MFFGQKKGKTLSIAVKKFILRVKKFILRVSKSRELVKIVNGKCHLLLNYLKSS